MSISDSGMLMCTYDELPELDKEDDEEGDGELLEKKGRRLTMVVKSRDKVRQQPVS